MISGQTVLSIQGFDSVKKFFRFQWQILGNVGKFLRVSTRSDSIYFRGKFFGIHSKNFPKCALKFSRISTENSSKFLRKFIRDFDDNIFKISKKKIRGLQRKILRLIFCGKFSIFQREMGFGRDYIHEKFSEVSAGCFWDINQEIRWTFTKFKLAIGQWPETAACRCKNVMMRRDAKSCR